MSIRTGERFEVLEERTIEGVGHYIPGLGYNVTARIIGEVQRWFDLGVAQYPQRKRPERPPPTKRPARKGAKAKTKSSAASFRAAVKIG